MMSVKERKGYRDEFLIGLVGAFVGGLLLFLPLGRVLKVIGAVFTVLGGATAALILIGAGIYLLFGSENDE